MPIVNGKRVLSSDPAYQATLNERGGINRTPNPAQTNAGNNMQPTVSADTLVNPPPKVTPPVPQVNTNDGSRTQGLINNTIKGGQEIIQSTSENARKRDEYAALLGAETFDASGMRTGLSQATGLTDAVKELRDVNSQIDTADALSNIQKSQIANAAGQTIGQAQREITQEDRENAIRNAGLAAKSATLQDNIDLAKDIVDSAMQDYYKDRELKNQNMIQQLDYFSGLADGETKQLIEKERRVYEEDQKKIQRVQTTIDAALASGAANASDMSTLTNPLTTDEEKLALAQLIVASGAKQERDMDLAIKATQLAKLREPVVATRETSVIDVNGTKQLIDTQTGDVIATFGADVSTDDISNARDIQFVNTVDTLKNHPGMSKAVGTTKLARFTPFKADVMTGQVSDFVGSVENITKQLTLNTFAEAKAKGITFGAGSEGEWKLLGESATKIAQWRRERDDGSLYYETSENNMNKELDTISNFGKMDALRKGINPSDIGVVRQEDGTYWTKNSDNTFTQLNVTNP